MPKKLDEFVKNLKDENALKKLFPEKDRKTISLSNDNITDENLTKLLSDIKKDILKDLLKSSATSSGFEEVNLNVEGSTGSISNYLASNFDIYELDLSNNKLTNIDIVLQFIERLGINNINIYKLNLKNNALNLTEMAPELVAPSDTTMLIEPNKITRKRFKKFIIKSGVCCLELQKNPIKEEEIASVEKLIFSISSDLKDRRLTISFNERNVICNQELEMEEESKKSKLDEFTEIKISQTSTDSRKSNVNSTESENESINLIAKQKSSNGYIFPNKFNRFIRELTRNPNIHGFPFRTLLATLVADSQYIKYGHATPLEKWFLLRAFLVPSFLDGVAFGMNVLWPLVFTGLLMRDIDYNRHLFPPNKRYNNTLSEILLGTSSVEFIYSSQFGTDLAGERSYWLWPTILLMLPVVTGMTNIVTKSLSYSYNNVSKRKFDVLWRNMGVDGRSTNLDNLINLTDENGNIPDKLFINNLLKIRALADIADSFKDKEDEALQKRGRKALQNLSDYTGASNKIISLYASYKLWSIGHAKSKKAHAFLPFSIIVALYLFYTKARYWETLMFHAMGAAQYAHKMDACEAQNGTWAYLPPIADYDCVSCDWDFVDFQDKYSVQGCLNQLFGLPQPMQSISQNITNLKLASTYFNISLVAQNFTETTTEVWQNFWNVFNPINFIIAPFVNISAEAKNPFFPGADWLQPVANFINEKSAAGIACINQPIGPDGVRVLFQNANVNHSLSNLTYIDVTASGIGNAGVEAVAQAVPYMPNLKVLILSAVGMDSHGFGKLCDVFVNHNVTLERLEIDGNPIPPQGIDDLAEALPHLQHLQELDLSGIDLSSANMKKLGQAISANSAIKTLKISDCNINDGQIAVLAPELKNSAVVSLDVSDNQLSDEGATFIVSNAGENLAYLNMAYNQMAGDGINDWVPMLADTAINTLDISGNQYAPEDVAEIIELTPENIVNISIADMPLGDAGVIAVTEQFNNGTHYFETINMSNNGMTDIGGVPLVASFAHLPLRNVNLAGNALTAETAASVIEWAVHGNVTNIDLSNNQIGSNITTTYTQHQANLTNVETFILRGNPVGGEFVVAYAKSLFTPTPDIDELGSAVTLSSDELHAINKSQPTTKTNKVDFTNCQVNTDGARALCRAMNPAKISMANIQLGENSGIDPNVVDSYSCQVSSANSVRPFAFFRPATHDRDANIKFAENQNAQSSLWLAMAGGFLPGFQTLVLLYVIYKLLQPTVIGTANYAKSFFNKNRPAENKNTGETKPFMQLKR